LSSGDEVMAGPCAEIGASTHDGEAPASAGRGGRQGAVPGESQQGSRAIDETTPARDGIALAGCRILRPAAAPERIEVVSAAGARRRFPPRVSTTLGICLKHGPAYEVTVNGRRLVYPADAICVRGPGCVWSSEPSTVGFLSVDISPTGWEDDDPSGRPWLTGR
jgi:hypothetical protein